MNHCPRAYYVYILTNRSGTLYIGVTGNLPERIREHKEKKYDGFTARYSIDRLIWFQEYGNASEAIEAEKRLKGWKREKKVALVNGVNPSWQDLFDTL